MDFSVASLRPIFKLYSKKYPGVFIDHLLNFNKTRTIFVPNLQDQFWGLWQMRTPANAADCVSLVYNPLFEKLSIIWAFYFAIKKSKKSLA
jgi:hypothetical protein